MTTVQSVSVEDIRMAAERLAPVAVMTPLLRQFLLGREVGANELYLKAECLQRTGAFKFRGAYNTLWLLRQQGSTKVVTSSSGNHGQAVAAAGQILGLAVTVVMPTNAVSVKVDSVRGYGGAVVFAGTTSIEREQEAMRIGSESGATVIGSFDDARIIAGQGTAGLEIINQLDGVELVVVPVGGGGLISGIATAVKEVKPNVRVVGVEPEGAADAHHSLRTGRVETLDTISTICDGLRTSHVGHINFPIMQRYLDDIVLVSDDEVSRAMRRLAFGSKLTVEPSGAVGVAAVLSGRIDTAGRPTAVLISGGNVDPNVYAGIVGAG